MLAGSMADQGNAGDGEGATLSRLRGFVRERRARRNLMFTLCLSVSGFVAVGSLLLGDWLEQRVGLFLLYWGFTCLSVILLMLLALYDILRIWGGEDR